jgi:hypothetical protein
MFVPGITGEIKAPAGVPTGGLFTSLNIGKNGLVYVFGFAFALAIVYLIYGGILWITSQGDKQKVMQARSRIIYTIIGLAVILLSFGIISILSGLLGVNIKNPSATGGF